MPLDLTLTLNLTDEDLAVIEHVVDSDPTCEPGQRVGAAWANRAFAALGVNGPAAVAAKVAKYCDSYLAAKAEAQAAGVPYKNAAEREADAAAELAALKGQA